MATFLNDFVHALFGSVKQEIFVKISKGQVHVDLVKRLQSDMPSFLKRLRTGEGTRLIPALLAVACDHSAMQKLFTKKPKNKEVTQGCPMPSSNMKRRSICDKGYIST